MKGTSHILNQKSLVIVFTYAPAGLGHLRVTDALYEGLPSTVSPLLLGSQARVIEVIHRILSIHMVFRRMFEWGQSSSFQHFFTVVYKWIIRSNRKLLMQQMTTLLDQRIDLPESVLIVATHYGLAHQAGAIKAQIEKQRNVKVILAVQVTDDSPQYIWYVPEADITFAPSEFTKKELLRYGKQVGYAPIPIEVTPYPVSPHLSQKLSAFEAHEREHQLDPESKSQIHVSVPISGAAVQLEYITSMMDTLYRTSHRFIFHVVTRSAPYTLPFLSEMIERQFSKLYVSPHDREVVNAYDKLYQEYKISLEVTKPSEQSFKTLLSPDQRGGAIMLFSEPVGRQEYDNIDFMRRHNLIPEYSDQQFLWKCATENKAVKETERGSKLFQEARHWRGMELPKDPVAAACFIWWCNEQRIFLQMMRYKNSGKAPFEVNSNGVSQFWTQVAAALEQDKASIC